MLTQLIPDQISRLWNIIKYAIESSVPPVSGEKPDRMNRILSAALCGKMDIWTSYVKSEKGNNFEGIATTEFLYNEHDGTKNMLLYSIFGYSPVATQKTYIGGLLTLAKYAKEKKCSKICAYTQKSEIVALAKRLGGDTSYTLITFDVDEIVQKLNELDLDGGEG